MTEPLVSPPPTPAPAPPAEGRHRKYRIAWLAASAITAAVCMVVCFAPTFAAPTIPTRQILIGAAGTYVVVTAVAASVILLYRRVLRGPDVLDMIVAGIVCFFLIGLCGYAITHLPSPRPTSTPTPRPMPTSTVPDPVTPHSLLPSLAQMPPGFRVDPSYRFYEVPFADVATIAFAADQPRSLGPANAVYYNALVFDTEERAHTFVANDRADSTAIADTTDLYLDSPSVDEAFLSTTQAEPHCTLYAVIRGGRVVIIVFAGAFCSDDPRFGDEFRGEMNDYIGLAVGKLSLLRP
jgi:hypothetical protein